jgi:DNA invertase Pin-like site-specific DNA recombinase
LFGEKLKVVVTHRDRLARFGFVLLEYLVSKNGGEVLVLDQDLATPEGELTQDLLAILHHFSCRLHGKRSHQGKKGSNLPDGRTEKPLQEVVRDFQVCLQRNSEALEAPEGIEGEELDAGCKIDSSKPS